MDRAHGPPRRMWAGSRFEFRAPIRVGDRVVRVSTIDDVSTKEGRTGKLVFVKVRHEVRCNDSGDRALVEFHDVVHRQAQGPGDVAPPPHAAPPEAAWRRKIVPDDVLLFRYSALTFNGHRIHCDRRYVTAWSCMETVRLWASDHDGWLTMDATAVLR